MKKYRVSYWEKESVWVRRVVCIESETKPTEKNLDELLGSEYVDYEQSDYNWETCEHEEYDLSEDFEVEALK